MKALSHARRSDQMFQLQSYLRALLWQLAVFKGVGELIGLADSQQKLRLREQWLNLHSALLDSGGQRGKIHVRGNVLLSRGLVKIRTRRVLPISRDRAAMPPSKLLLPGVAVVDGDDEPSLH